MVDNDNRIPLKDAGIIGTDQQTDLSTQAPITEAATNSSPRFATKEEYIKFLLDNKKIKRDRQTCHDGKIYLKGCLKIDNTVVKHLDWSDIVVDSAVVENGVISKYKNLPHTRTGIKTNLTTLNIDEYMSHQVYDATKKGENYIVNGILRIPDIEKLPDFSSVTANQVFYYKKGIINPALLPTALNGFFGIGPDNFGNLSAEAFKIAKSKGLRRKQITNDKSGIFKHLLTGLKLFNRQKVGEN